MKLTGSWAPPPAFDAAGWQGPGGGPAGLTRLLSQRTGGNVSTGTGARYVWYTLWGGGARRECKTYQGTRYRY